MQEIYGKKEAIKIKKMKGPEQERYVAMLNLRLKHGWNPNMKPQEWSKKILLNWAKIHKNGFLSTKIRKINGEKISVECVNMPQIFDFITQKFFFLGSSWKLSNKKEQVNYILHNWPVVAGFQPTFADLVVMPVELVDNANHSKELSRLNDLNGKKYDPTDLFQRIASTGIGYRGVHANTEFVPWTLGYEPLEMSGDIEGRLKEMAAAIFTFYDVIQEAWNQDIPDVRSCLEYKIPDRICKINEGQMRLVRPDIIIDEDGNLVCSELESSPGGSGMMFAMQHGYGIENDFLLHFAKYLNGRKYICIFTHEYIDYIWEQSAFCQALRDIGVDAEVWVDNSAQNIQNMVRQSWRAMECQDGDYVARCNPEMKKTLQEKGFDKLVCFFSKITDFPEKLGPENAIFRFGYADNFSIAFVKKMAKWQETGTEIVNGLSFIYENKGIFALLCNTKIREMIAEKDLKALNILDRSIAETKLLVDDVESHGCFSGYKELIVNRKDRLVKYAGYDGNNENWGARSVEVGMTNSNGGWEKTLKKFANERWPVVSQKFYNSQTFNVPYVKDGKISILRSAKLRLNVFMMRDGNGEVSILSPMATLRSGSIKIHGASDAVMTPVVFK